ncbi:MAG: hypothetical protein ACK5PF_02945, partial [bacterium]
ALGRGDLGTIQYPQVGAIAKELGLFIPSLGMEGMKDYSLAEQLAVAGALRADGTMPSLELLRQLAAQDRFSTLAGSTTFQSSGSAYSRYAESAVALARSAFRAGFSARDVRSFLGQLRNDYSLKQNIQNEIQRDQESLAGQDFPSEKGHIWQSTDLLAGGILDKKGPYLVTALNALDRLVNEPDSFAVYETDRWRGGSGDAEDNVRVALFGDIANGPPVFKVPLSLEERRETAQGLKDLVEAHLKDRYLNNLLGIPEHVQLADQLLGRRVLYLPVPTEYGDGGAVQVQTRTAVGAVPKGYLERAGNVLVDFKQGGGRGAQGQPLRQIILDNALADIDQAVDSNGMSGIAEVQRLYMLGRAAQALFVTAGGFRRGGAGITDILVEAAWEVITGQRSGRRIFPLDLLALSVSPGQFTTNLVSGLYFNPMKTPDDSGGSDQEMLRSPGADGYTTPLVGDALLRRPANANPT